MRGDTHVLGGICTGLVYAGLTRLSISEMFAVIGISTIGSLLPDIDICTSKLGSKVKPISKTIGKLFGHRTLFHSPLIYLAISISLWSIFPQFDMCWTSLFLGIMSHLLLDMFNAKGIPLLYPYPKKFHIACLKCGGKGEKIIRAMLTLGILIFYGIFAINSGISIPNSLSDF